jgi:hypothetical protein
MNRTSPLFDDRIAEWLEDDPVHAPAQLLETVVAALPSIGQRRPGLWARLELQGGQRLAAAAVIMMAGLLLMAIAGALIGGPTPGPSPSPPFGLTQSFTSTQHGFTIRYGAGWRVAPATRPWPAGTAAALPPDPMLDAFTIPGTPMTFVGVSQPLAVGVSPTEWIATYEASYPNLPAECWPTPDHMERTLIDGEAAWIHGGLASCQFTEALVFSGGRVYEFTGYAGTSVFDRALFDALIATVVLEPAAATSASPRATITAPPVESATPPSTPSGAPLPAELIGAWYHAAPGWWWFIRAGDPECVQAVGTTGDCVFWQRATAPKEIGGASMVGQDLRVAWKTGFCSTIKSIYSVALQGDSLTLVDIGGGCDGGTFALTRAGTGTAPSAPPPPTP